MQVWQIDSGNFYTGESYFVDEAQENEITTPITIGCVKPKWNGTKWIEGATAEEIVVWQEEQNNQPKKPTEIEKLRLEQAKANSEMIDLMMALIYGGM